jgi:glucokinase
MAKFYLGVDLGGTEIKMAIVDDRGNICEESSIPNSRDSEPKEKVGEIIQRAKSMKLFAKLSGTGVGVAGDIDQEKGVVRFSPNLLKWKKTPLRKMLEKGLPKPVVIDNDANAAALGAFWLDACGKAKNLICITLGTGVGGGLVVEGKLYRGATGSAGEIGHIPFEADGPRCNCGSHGCLERYVGAPFLSMRAREAVKKQGSNIIMRLLDGDLDKLTPKTLADAAKLHDRLAVEIWHDTGFKLGIVLAGVINLMNPEMIVLAGGVSRAGDLLLKPLKATIRERAFTTSARACKIVISKSMHKLGVVGSALLAK